MTRRPARFLLGVVGLTLIISATVLANNPIAVNSGGNPTKWGTFPISYTTDGGTLGALSTIEANTLTTEAFGAWSGVTTATVTATASGGSLADGDVNTLGEFNALGCVNVNPIVYDTDGTLTDALLGAGASNNVLGFAGPCAISPHPNGFLPGNSDTILGGRAVMNGKSITGPPVSALTRSRSKGVFIHELGHFLGLGHSQVNLNCLTDLASCPNASADLSGVPTMFPILLNQTESPNVSFAETLTFDDKSAISTLYPAAGFATTLGTITGSVRFSDGVNEAQGINVIARLTTDPRATAISNVSGVFALANHGNNSLGLQGSSAGNPDPTTRGDFTIPGLPPGTYTLEIESVNASFIGGSSVGALSRSTGRGENIPIPSPAVAECFGGPESNTDNPLTCQNLVLTVPGTVLNNNNFTLNETFATLDASETVLARNNGIFQATPIGAGTISRSISGPDGADDEDFYALSVTQNVPISIEIKSRRLATPRYLDSVIELVDNAQVQLLTCQIGDVAAPPYNQPCIDDDYTPTGGSLTKDSKLQFNPATTGTVFLRVSDRFSDARPDFLYDLIIAGVVPPPIVRFTPASLDLGTQSIGIAGFPQDVQLTNTGGISVTLGAFTKTGGNTGDFSFGAPGAGAPTCNFAGGTVLATGGSCYFGVTFTPGAAGARSTTVSVTHNAADSPSNLLVSGIGASGPLNDNFANATSMSPNPFSDAQNTQLATKQPGIDIPITTGGFPGSACTVSPDPANNKSIWYKYVIPTNATSTGHFSLSFPSYNAAVGYGIYSGATPVAQFCNNVPIGSQFTANLQVGGGASAGWTLYFMVAAAAGDGGVTPVSFTFSPDATNANLSVAVTDNNLVFTEGSTGSYVVTASNAGGGGATATTPEIPVQVQDVLPQGLTFASASSPGNVWSCSAPPPGTFVACSLGATTIGAGASAPALTINVNVAAPAAASSPISNFVTVFGGGDITSNNNFNFDTTNVNPAPAPVVDIAPPTKDFGNIPVSSASANQSFTLLNSGNGTLTVSSITRTGLNATQFNLLLNTGGFTCAAVFPFNLTAGASCTFGVNFVPASGGAKTASITVASNATSSPNIVALAGAGTFPGANNYIGANGGKWETPANWSLGLVPTVAHDVTISGANSPLIDATTGVRTIQSLTMTSTNPLVISGGSLTIVNPSTATNINVSGGTLTTTGSMDITGVFNLSAGTHGGAGTLTILGTMNWTGGSITGPTTAATTQIFAGRTLNINGSGPILALNLRTIQNAGTINYLGSSDVSNAASNTTLINQAGGVLDFQVGHGFFGSYSWTNAGTIKMTGSGGGGFGFGGLGTSPGNSVTNSGTVQALTGTLGLGTTYTQTAGSLTIASDARVSGGSFAINGGTLSGAGEVQGNVTNAAVVNPGSSPGEFRIQGNYTQTAAGVLNIEIGGNTFGNYDFLQITGTATLAGTLNASSFGGFTPIAGNSFAIMSFTSKTGDFTTNNLTVNGVALGKNYNASTLALSVGGAVGTISLSTNSADFGSREVFTTSAPQTIIISNIGAGDLTITSLDGSSDSANDYNIAQPIIAGDCDFSVGPVLIPAGGQCNLRAVFTPLTLGPRPQHVVIMAANASNSGIAFDVTGIGLAGAPASLTATGGTLQSAVVNTAFGTPLLASVRDTHDYNVADPDQTPVIQTFTMPVAGVGVTFTIVPAGGASATFAGGGTVAVVNTDGGGIAVAPAITANGVAGTYTVTATLNALPVATYTLTNTPAGQVIRTIAGGGAGGASNICSQSTFGGIFGGFYYIRSCQQIYKVSIATGVWTPVAGTGIGGYSGDGGPATQAQIFGNGGIFVDGSGNVFIADAGNHRVRKVTAATGIIDTIAGTGVAGFNSNNNDPPATASQLAGPQGVFVDALGVVYIADTGNHQIRKLTAAGDTLRTVAGNTGPGGFTGDGFDATTTSLNNPQGVFVDGTGQIYIADTSNNRIRKVDVTGIITTVAGSGTNAFAGDGGLATAASIAAPNSVWVDAGGNIYIPDVNNVRIRKVSGTDPKNINTIVGTGTAGYAGDAGPASAALIRGPSNPYVDGGGNLFFATNSGIRRVDGVTNVISTAVGNSAFGSGGDAGPAASAQLSFPTGVVRDRYGNIYIADSDNYRIRKVNGTTGVITTIAGTGVSGMTGDGGQATLAQIRPFASGSITVDSSGNVFFVDRDGSVGNLNCRIRKIDTAGIITSVTGNGTCAFSGDGGLATAAGLGNPVAVFADATGNLYISQQGRVRVINRQVGPITVNNVLIAAGNIATVAGNGTNGFGGDGGQATVANGGVTPMLNNQQGLFVDAVGNLYIADAANNRIRKVSTTGVLSTVAGTGTTTFNGDNILATGANLNAPFGVSLDAANNIFIVEGNNHRVREVLSATGFIQPFAGNGVRGFAGDLGQAANAAMNSPVAVALDTAGNLLITDRANARIRYVGALNPVPTITNLVPPTITAGGGNFVLTVNGTNFVPNSFVNFNGNPRVTTYVSPTQVTAQILAADITAVGDANVTVSNPIPGGGTTANSVFTINAGVTITFDGGPGGLGTLWTTAVNWDLDRIPINTDTVVIPAGFNVTLDSGAQTITALNVVGTASLTINGGSSLTFTAASAATNLTLSAGTLTANGTLSISGALNLSGTGVLNGTGNVTLNSPLTWTGGTMSGTGTFTNNGSGAGSASISGGTLDAKTFINSGTVNFPNATAFTMNNTAVLNNQTGAVINAQGAGSITNSAGASGNINNSGTFNRTTAAGVFTLSGVNLTNSNAASATNILQGELNLTTTSYSQTAGTTTLNGGDLRAVGATISGGVVTGVNTVFAGTGALTVSNAGRVQPGLSPGILNVNGTGATSYSQVAPGTLDIEINGTTVGTQYDRLNVTGAASLNGVLNVTLGGPFIPAVGDSFTILTSTGARTGAFAPVNLPALPAGRAWAAVVYNPNSVVLSVTAVAGTITFNNVGGDNLWTNPANWDLGRIPVAGDTVNIPGAFNVTLNGGSTHTIAVLNSTTTGTLTINGGATLITTGASNATTISITGDGAGVGGADGHLTANSTLAVGTVSVFNGGFLDGTGNVTVANSFSLGSAVANGFGTISGTGLLTNNGLSFFTVGAIDGKTFNSNGTSSMTGTLTMSNGAVFNNLATRTLNAQPGGAGGSITQGAGAVSAFNNQGIFVLNPGIAVNFDVTGMQFSNTGTVTITTGSLRVLGGGGTYTQTGAGAITEFSSSVNGDMTVANPLQLQGGVLRGRRTITGTVNNTGGTVGPGLSAGILTFAGSYVQGANPAALNIEIGGTTPGNAAGNYDQLSVTGAPGTVTLSGTLNVSLIGGFVPAIGNSFTVIQSAGALAGSFGGNLNFPVLPAGRAWRITYNNAAPGSVVLDIVAPAVGFNPISKDFGNVQVGVTTATSDIQLTNTGGATLNITSISLTGTDAAQFSIVAPTAGLNCVGLASRPPGQSCNIGIRFTPASIGLKSAQISVVDDAVGSPHTVPLSGTGQVPFGVFGPPSPFGFGNQPVGSDSTQRVVTVSNIGPGTTLTITAVAFGGTDPGDFIFSNTSCTPTPVNLIFPAGICSFAVTFHPNSTGAKSATVTITDNSNNVAGTLQVFTFTGTGVSATVSLAPSPANFANQRVGTTSSSTTVTVTNNGGLAATLNAGTPVTITGANLGDFAIVPGTTTCIANFVLNAGGGSCVVNLTFSPTATGARTAVLNIASSATGSPHTATLNGTGILANVSLAPNPLNFGNQRQAVTSASQTITVTNSGNENSTLAAVSPVTISGTNQGDFTIVPGTTTCVANFVLTAGGGSCLIRITFTPGALGARTATVNVADDAPGTPQQSTLNGTGVLPNVTLAPDPLNFGNQKVATTSAFQTITVTNSGTQASTLAAVNPVTFTGGNAADFTVAAGTTCVANFVLNAGGGSCIIRITFTPGALGARNTTVNVADDAPNTPQQAAITGTGVLANVTVTPNPVGFGSVALTTTSAPSTITVTNVGTLAATLAAVNPVTITGGQAADYAIVGGTTTCVANFVLAAGGGSCVINVTFTPGALGLRSATLNVFDDAPASPQTTALTGTGVQSAITLNPSPVNFPNQKVATTSGAITVTVTNTGTLAATLNAGTPVTIINGNFADFAIVPGTTTCVASFVLNANGGFCVVNITFTPGAVGARTATLNIADSDPNSPQQAQLNGSGVLANVTVTPNPVPFAARIVATTSAPLTVTVTNTGTLAATLAAVSPVTLTGANPGDFAIVGGTTCVANFVLTAGGGSCIVNVAFTPAASGARAATLNVFDDAPASPQQTALTGTGQTPPTADLSQATILFGSKRVGTSTAPTTVTVTNNGQATLVIASIVKGGADASQFTVVGSGANPCNLVGGNVLGGANCTLDVTFSPTATGLKNATITITDNANTTGAPGTQQVITLSGTGIQALITLAPNPTTFANQRVGTPSAPLTVTVTNSGTDIATLAAANAVTITGANAANFVPAAGTTCINGFVLAAAPGPGNSCIINIVFTPSATGARAATVNVADDAPGTPQTAALTGTGIQALITLAPNPANFGNLKVGTPSAPLAVTVTNTGTDIATLAAANAVTIGLPGANAADFATAAGTTCTNGLVLAASPGPGNTCVINIVFTPGAVGARAATVAVADDAPGTPQTAALNGTGVLANLTLAPSPLTFGGVNLGSNSTMAVIVTNNGGLQATLTAAPTITGANSADFTFAAGTTCANGTVLAAGGGSCIANITFAPLAPLAPAARTATLTVTNDNETAGASPHTVTLNGTATQPGFSLSSTSVPDFGGVQVGMSQAATGAGIITLSNPGSGPLTITSITVGAGGANSSPNDFSRTTTCPLAPATLAAGGNCTITASMNPQAGSIGPHTASISIAHNAPTLPNPAAITLSGTGVDFAVVTTAIPGPVTAGASASYTLNFDMSGGNSLFPTTFTCSGLPLQAVCNFTPASIPAGSPDTSVTLAITTTSNTAQSNPGAPGPMTPSGNQLPPSSLLFASMGLLGMFALRTLRAHALRTNAARLCLLALVVVAGGYLTGCAGGGSEGVSGTPPGSYTVTVTATSGTVQRSTNITLNVL